jgi:transketolase
MKTEKITMREAFISQIYDRMCKDDTVFFLAADFGSPKLDHMRERFSDRFINVGIAEQNLINVSTGLALQGFTVYAYGIAPFLTMRAYEQIRNNLSLLSQLKELNINLVGVGAGLSYDVSGPTHHCLEDITIMRTLPHVDIFSPSDWVLAEKFADYSLSVKKPKYIRFDSKALPAIYGNGETIDFHNGFYELSEGDAVCLVSTGYMTHIALKAVAALREDGISAGLIDVFLFTAPHADLLRETMGKYKCLITIEEAFIHRGGLDSLILSLAGENNMPVVFHRMGFRDRYAFEIGERKYLHKLNNLDENSIIAHVKTALERV